jgi:hypothetical protein
VCIRGREVAVRARSLWSLCIRGHEVAERGVFVVARSLCIRGREVVVYSWSQSREVVVVAVYSWSRGHYNRCREVVRSLWS